MIIVKYSKVIQITLRYCKNSIEKLCSKVREVRNTSWLNACNLAQESVKNMQHGDIYSCLIKSKLH